MKVYCVFEEDNAEASDESFYSWEVLKKIFDTEKKANDWIKTQKYQSFLKITPFEVE